MALLDTMVVMPMDTGSGEDIAVNNFHFDTVAPSASDGPTLDAIQVALGTCVDAYTDLLGSDINPAAIRWKVYDALATPPRAPIRDVILKAGMTITGSTMPHELACVASFQGDRVSGVPQARRRGRIYIGPLSTAAVTGSAINAAMIASVNGAMKGLADAGNPTAGWTWCIFSRRGSSPPTPPTVVEVKDGWTDNAIDIQRRRGVKATVRTTWASVT
jgi:hypothetical protein